MLAIRYSVLLGVVTCRLLAVGLTLVVSTASICHGQVINEDLKLLPSDGAQGDYFGRAIAINKGVIAAGAYRDNENGRETGSAYLFDASTGAQTAKLVPSDGAAGDQFGWSIAIDNGVVAVGATLDDDHGGNSGSAYLFDATTGDQLFKLLPSDGGENDVFGWSIAIDNGDVAVGATWGDNRLRSGSAYLFDASTGAQIAKLLASDGAELDHFGVAIAIDNGAIAVGANRDDDNGSASGSAYVFDVDNCPPDLNDDGVVNTLDFLLFLGAFASGDPLADWNGDGSIDTLDFLAFLNAFVGGCP